MNDEELRKYRTRFSEESLRFVVLLYTFELYGMATPLEDGQLAGLTSKGRELAEVLFTEEKYRNYAIERVDSVRQNSSREDWRQNYVN